MPMRNTPQKKRSAAINLVKTSAVPAQSGDTPRNLAERQAADLCNFYQHAATLNFQEGLRRRRSWRVFLKTGVNWSQS